MYNYQFMLVTLYPPNRVQLHGTLHAHLAYSPARYQRLNDLINTQGSGLWMR